MKAERGTEEVSLLNLETFIYKTKEVQSVWKEQL